MYFFMPASASSSGRCDIEIGYSIHMNLGLDQIVANFYNVSPYLHSLSKSNCTVN